MSPDHWWTYWLGEPQVQGGHVWVPDAAGDRAMGAYGATDLEAIQRLIAFCDHGLAYHAAKRP